MACYTQGHEFQKVENGSFSVHTLTVPPGASGEAVWRKEIA